MKRERKDNVTALFPGMSLDANHTGANHTGDAQSSEEVSAPGLFVCECGSSWFRIIASLRRHGGSFGGVNGYVRWDPERGGQVICNECDKVYS